MHMVRFPKCGPFVMDPVRFHFYRIRTRQFATTPSRHHRLQRIISTLNPAHITPNDFVDFEKVERSRVRFPWQPAYQHSTLFTYDFRGKFVSFPTHARGFMYYHTEQGYPLAGSIRLRVTADNAPSSFPRGEDLLLPSGFPWQIMLAQIANLKTYLTVQDQLLREQLVTEEQLTRCRELFGNRGLYYPRLTLFRTDQPFLVSFLRPLRLCIVGQAELHRARLEHIFTDQGNGGHNTPFKGSAIARFERSTLPQHANRRILVLRIVQITEPVVSLGKTGKMVEPKAGALLTLRLHGKERPWAYDVDCGSSVDLDHHSVPNNSVAIALRALWDASVPKSST
ncbi:hypothetical protein B0H10DRAFT_2094014 [Mycena sp. CBHHK59/15]|nr:hypothetical protein B0H10DRAFT_2094014 [Mycena sp. CBHHK59/15]